MLVHFKNPANQIGLYSSVQNCIYAVTCFLLLQIRLGLVVDNVIQYNNHVECLDLHLSEIILNSYRGTLPEIIFAKFFILRARVLKEMRFSLHLFRKNEWFVDQHWWLQQNGIGSENVEFHFWTLDDKVIGSHRVNPIHDFPLQKWWGFETSFTSGNISLNLSDIHVQRVSASVCSWRAEFHF